MRNLLFVFVLFGASLAAQTAARPSDVVADSALLIGKRVSWTGKQIRVSTTLLNGQRVTTNRVFALLDAQGKEDRLQIFAVEGNATETQAAQALNTKKDDSGIRRVAGTIGSVGDIEVYVNGKPATVKGPRLTGATLDAK